MTQLQTPSRTLGQLNEDDRYRAFDDLQLSMGEAWDSIQKNLVDESVRPAVNLHQPAIKAREERVRIVGHVYD